MYVVLHFAFYERKCLPVRGEFSLQRTPRWGFSFRCLDLPKTTKRLQVPPKMRVNSAGAGQLDSRLRLVLRTRIGRPHHLLQIGHPGRLRRGVGKYLEQVCFNAMFVCFFTDVVCYCCRPELRSSVRDGDKGPPQDIFVEGVDKSPQKKRR